MHSRALAVTTAVLVSWSLVAMSVAARPLRPDEQARVAAQPPTQVVARLIDLGTPNPPHCGRLHVAVVMRYEVLEVVGERPLYGPPGNTWDVIHGCPELPRARYRAGSGNVTAFHVGDVHRMLVSQNVPTGSPVSVLDMWPRTGSNRPLWALRTDQASAP
ncbi:MAG: hypothetical protein IPG81_19580 [Sandaracinaceae bacterium]|jgi:hypothetical protein|nr:hypothetical protein [Sandaracinaceae bacterium]